MTDAASPGPESLRMQLQRQYQRVVRLRGRRYAQADPSARNAAAGRAEILVAKQRHGPTGVADLLFDGATTHFSGNPARGRAEVA